MSSSLPAPQRAKKIVDQIMRRRRGRSKKVPTGNNLGARLGRWLYAERSRRQITTQEQLAVMAGVSRSYVIAAEQGRDIPLDVFVSLCRGLKLEPAHVLAQLTRSA